MSVLHAPTRLWTVEEYEDLGRAGFLNASDRVELLNGEIIVMSPIGYRHATAVNLLTQFLVENSRRRFVVTPGNPFILDQRSEPQPDLCLAELAILTQGHHASPDQIFLVIEVSDSTLSYDRKDKGPAYARNGVREYWVLNLEDNVLELYREPSAEGYRDVCVAPAEETVAPLAFPDLKLRVGDYLP